MAGAQGRGQQQRPLGHLGYPEEFSLPRTTSQLLHRRGGANGVRTVVMLPVPSRSNLVNRLNIRFISFAVTVVQRLSTGRGGGWVHGVADWSRMTSSSFNFPSAHRANHRYSSSSAACDSPTFPIAALSSCFENLLSALMNKVDGPTRGWRNLVRLAQYGSQIASNSAGVDHF